MKQPTKVHLEGPKLHHDDPYVPPSKPDANTAPRVCSKCHKPEGEPHPYKHSPRYEEVV